MTLARSYHEYEAQRNTNDKFELCIDINKNMMYYLYYKE